MGFLLTEIGSLLVANNVGVLGTDLFLGRMLDKPDIQTVVYEGAGSSPLEVMGPSLPPNEHPRIQVVCRGQPEDYVGPRTKLDAVWRVLAGVLDVVIDGTRYLRIEPVGSPFVLNRDESQRVLVSANFDVTKELS